MTKTSAMFGSVTDTRSKGSLTSTTCDLPMVTSIRTSPGPWAVAGRRRATKSAANTNPRRTRQATAGCCARIAAPLTSPGVDRSPQTAGVADKGLFTGLARPDDRDRVGFALGGGPFPAIAHLGLEAGGLLWLLRAEESRPGHPGCGDDPVIPKIPCREDHLPPRLRLRPRQALHPPGRPRGPGA